MEFQALTTVASRRQFEYLFCADMGDSPANAYEHFLKIVSTCYFFSEDRNSPGDHSIHPGVKRIANQIHRLLKKNCDDLQIYSSLHEMFHNDMLASLNLPAQTHTLYLNGTRTSASYRNERATRRVQNLLEVLCPDHKSVDHYLDLGCSQGEITGLLGKTLQLDSSDIIGCDLTDAESANEHKNIDLPYTYLASTKSSIPMADQSVSLVTALMVLHHLNLDTMMQEVHRILKRGGLLLIREHDCPSDQPWMRVVFDVMHGMWNYVWSETPEEDDFINNFKATYRSREQLSDELQKFGFELLLDTTHRRQWYLNGESADRDPLRPYYAIYRKPLH